MSPLCAKSSLKRVGNDKINSATGKPINPNDVLFDKTH